MLTNGHWTFSSYKFMKIIREISNTPKVPKHRGAQLGGRQCYCSVVYLERKVDMWDALVDIAGREDVDICDGLADLAYLQGT